jgi:hypothetical protein
VRMAAAYPQRADSHSRIIIFGSAIGLYKEEMHVVEVYIFKLARIGGWMRVFILHVAECMLEVLRQPFICYNCMLIIW